MPDYEVYRQLIVDTAQELTHKGFLSATGGNLSVRIPDAKGFAITPSNYDYLKMIPEDICVLDMDLNQIAGKRQPSVESAMHAAIFKARLDVNAIIHTHQVYPSTLAIIGKPIPALFDEQVRFLGRSVEIIPYASSGTGSLAEIVAKSVSDQNNAYMMANHGALLFGGDMERAVHNVSVLEKCALVYLFALCTGEKVNRIPAAAREAAFARLREDQVENPGKPGGMTWKRIHLVNEDVMHWLLEDDSSGVRYLALRDLLRKPADDPELVAARKKAHGDGPIKEILDAMDPQGFWEKPGPGYGPKYKSTVWALILLAQLGASIEEDLRIRNACDYLMAHAWHPQGQFAAGEPVSYTIDCLQGNLCRALTELGYEDSRLDKAFEWMARSVTGEGIAPKEDKKASMRYYAYKCGPNFQCGANNSQPCAWGAAKILLAFSRLPLGKRTPIIEKAIQQGVDFLFSIDLITAAWPTRGGNPNRDWWLFGFPVFYVTDLLQVAEALVGLGYAGDNRMQGLLELIRGKQDAGGRWLLEYPYGSKTWGKFGTKNKPNKWVTLRALRVLKG